MDISDRVALVMIVVVVAAGVRQAWGCALRAHERLDQLRRAPENDKVSGDQTMPEAK